MFDLGALWSTTSHASSGRLTADDILQFARELKEEGFIPPSPPAALTPSELGWMKIQQEQPEPMILVAPKRYNMIRYYIHLSKLRPLPSRKLRKCYLRKRMKQLQRTRRRYAE